VQIAAECGSLRPSDSSFGTAGGVQEPLDTSDLPQKRLRADDGSRPIATPADDSRPLADDSARRVTPAGNLRRATLTGLAADLRAALAEGDIEAAHLTHVTIARLLGGSVPTTAAAPPSAPTPLRHKLLVNRAEDLHAALGSGDIEAARVLHEAVAALFGTQPAMATSPAPMLRIAGAGR